MVCAAASQTVELIRVAEAGAGAKVNNFANGTTPLLAAVTKNQSDTVKVLLDAADAYDVDEWTPLLRAARGDHAARWGCGEVIPVLLRAGADVNRRDRSGATALAWARQSKVAPVIDALLAAGAK